jgi:nitrogen regulatory protein PII
MEDVINKLVERVGGDVIGGKVFLTDVQTKVDLSSKERGESAI